jgi:hypothetical protein
MPYGTVNADLVVGTNGNKISPENTFGFRNRIINGAMVIDQRNAGASVTPATSQYTLDRWYLGITQASKFSIQQNAGSVTTPVGFANYLGATVVSAYSITATDTFTLRQYIEGFNTADLAWGTANAKTVTLSFQVYSSLTGTFGGVIQNSGASRCYPFTYSISSANTWTQISVTIAGDTSGTWVGATNGIGIGVLFGLGVGSTYSGTAGAWSGSSYYGATGATSVVGTASATFYITGVQLEVGSNATSFEYRPINTELTMCQRYYQTDSTACASIPTSASNLIYSGVKLSPIMRATPTVGISSITYTGYGIFDSPITYSSLSTSSNFSFAFNTNNPNSRTASGSGSFTFTASAEL